MRNSAKQFSLLWFRRFPPTSRPGAKNGGSLNKRGECIKHVSGYDRAQYVSVLCSWLLQTAKQTCGNVHYRNLQVSNTDDIPTIKRAYRKLSLRHHPDKGGRVVDFDALNVAYQVLCSSTQRALYDTGGKSLLSDFLAPSPCDLTAGVAERTDTGAWRRVTPDEVFEKGREFRFDQTSGTTWVWEVTP